MELGVFFFATDYSIDIAELAVELEQRGFTTLLQPEHTHIPASRKTEWPGGGDLPLGLRRQGLRPGGVRLQHGRLHDLVQ